MKLPGCWSPWVPTCSWNKKIHEQLPEIGKWRNRENMSRVKIEWCWSIQLRFLSPRKGWLDFFQHALYSFNFSHLFNFPVSLPLPFFSDIQSLSNLLARKATLFKRHRSCLVNFNVFHLIFVVQVLVRRSTLIFYSIIGSLMTLALQT